MVSLNLYVHFFHCTWLLALFDTIQPYLTSSKDIPMSFLVDVLLIPGIDLDVIQLYAIHAEEVDNGCITSEPVSISTVCDDLTERLQAYAEQQRGQGISLVYAALNGDLSWCYGSPSGGHRVIVLVSLLGPGLVHPFILDTLSPFLWSVVQPWATSSTSSHPLVDFQKVFCHLSVSCSCVESVWLVLGPWYPFSECVGWWLHCGCF